MHTLVAFYESITNGSTNVEVNGVLDQSMTLDAANRFQSPWLGQVRAAHVHGVNLSAARINAPSLRTIALPEIYPAAPAADIAANTGPIVMGDRGPRLQPQESFIIEVSRAGADAQPVLGALWISPQIIPAAAGPAITVRATASPTIVAGSWVLASITFDQVLPAGTYEVVGLAVVCNDCSYARLVYPGVSQFRPGVVVQDAYGDYPWTPEFRFGRFGSFGRFVHNAPPSIEFLGDTAGAESAVVYLDVIKVQ